MFSPRKHQVTKKSLGLLCVLRAFVVNDFAETYSKSAADYTYWQMSARRHKDLTVLEGLWQRALSRLGFSALAFRD